MSGKTQSDLEAVCGFEMVYTQADAAQPAGHQAKNGAHQYIGNHIGAERIVGDELGDDQHPDEDEIDLV
jgi:hypothetical protein